MAAHDANISRDEMDKISLNRRDSPQSTDTDRQDENIFGAIDSSTRKTTLKVDDQIGRRQQVHTAINMPEGMGVSGSNNVDVNQDLALQTQIASVSDSDADNDTILPETLTRLTSANGSEVFLIGTAHFSPKSVQDVKKVIRTVRPSAVILELCRERAFMLSLDEESLLEQNRKLSFDKIKSAIAEKGLAQGLIYIMFIKMSASLTEKLGLAPGSEFRAGSAEALKIPGCSVVLGDRSLAITVARAVASVSTWQKIKLIYHVLANDVAITQEDVEKCKDKDILEQLLEELGGEFPGFKRVLLDERNVYLAHSIYQWAQNYETSLGPQRLVAIVGIGHVAGIVENWGKTTNEDIRLLNQVPKKSKTRRIVSKTIKYCSVALLVYIGYRVIVPSNIQTAIAQKLTGN